jgi:prepilin-type N-terminal cleavage/methylation domain-containing protein
MIKMRDDQKGFSLNETMVTVAIVGILGLIAVPNLVTALPGYRLKSSARELCSNLRKARSLAVKQNRTISVDFYINDNRYLIDGSDTIALASGITFGCGNAAKSATGESPPADGISFYKNTVSFTPQGLVNGTSGYVYLQNNKGQTFGIGARTSGSIVMRQWNGSEWK